MHNFDADESHCLRVLRVLRFYVLRSRSNESGEARDFDGLREGERKRYAEKQAALVARGAATAALTAVATHVANVEGNLADEALELLLEMTNGGNRVVQDAVFEYCDQYDRDNKFLNHLHLRMAASESAIDLRKERTLNGFVPMTAEQREEYQNAAQTFLVMQSLCEGHNEATQNIFRDQEGHSSHVNLVRAGRLLKSWFIQPVLHPGPCSFPYPPSNSTPYATLAQGGGRGSDTLPPRRHLELVAGHGGVRG